MDRSLCSTSQVRKSCVAVSLRRLPLTRCPLFARGPHSSENLEYRSEYRTRGLASRLREQNEELLAEKSKLQKQLVTMGERLREKQQHSERLAHQLKELEERTQQHQVRHPSLACTRT